MTYKIKRILHSGTFGERGTSRTDGRYPLRIGRTCRLRLDRIENGWPMVVYYLTDTDGSDYSGNYMVTSTVVGMIDLPSSLLVETQNSIFEFEKMESQNV